MDAFKKGWFSELSELWPGQCMSLEIQEILHQEKTEYQDIKIFQSKNHGRVLALDGVIQLTERDEFSYHEMLANLPVNSHPDPQNVLVIGGGDGGTVRELTKNPAVKTITMCEIDDRVVEASKRFLPSLSVGFQSPKLTLHIGDGFAFMGQLQNEFDVIITDSSDPPGPGAALFQKSYYDLVKKALKPGGIFCCQDDCVWLDLDLVKDVHAFCRELYPVVDYANCAIPSYPSGQIGFIMCGLNNDTNFREPLRTFTETELEAMNMKYYNVEIHKASFVLPQFAKKVLSQQ